MSICDNTPDNPFAIKKNVHIPCGYSMLTSYAYNKTLNENVFDRGKDCLSKFCKTLSAQVNKIINILQKPMNPLTDHANANRCFIWEKRFVNDKNAIKVRDHCHYTGKYRGAAHNPCNLQYKISKSIPVVFHNGSNYDFHLIIKQLAHDFKGPFSSFGENTEKHMTISICIFKKTDADKKPIAYQIKFIDSFSHMPQSLSNLVDNLAGLNKNLLATTLINRFPNTYKISDMLLIITFYLQVNYDIYFLLVLFLYFLYLQIKNYTRFFFFF